MILSLDKLYIYVAKRLLLANTKKIILLEGMGSAGSTLLSNCFLQHSKVNGVKDLLHTWDFNIWLKGSFAILIRRAFLPLSEPYFFVKFTCGHQNLQKIIESFHPNDDMIAPVFIARDLRTVLSSRIRMYGGVNDRTYEFLEAMGKYVSDFFYFHTHQYPVIQFEKLVLHPEPTIRRLCNDIGISYQESMTKWSKPDTSILDSRWGRVYPPPFNRTKAVCDCQFDSSMLRYLQTKFEDFFKFNRYPLLSEPINLRYAINSMDNLYFA